MTSRSAVEERYDGARIEAARERQSHVRHELRGPLAVMYPLLSLLLRESAGELTPKQREFLEILERNVQRLAVLITGVADSGWSDCSAVPAVPSEVALHRVAEEVVTVLPPTFDDSPRITVETSSSVSTAWADGSDVRQIVANLVRNALLFTPASGDVCIRVAAGEEAGTVTLAVVDTGPGMPPEELVRAFEFGFRGELAARLKVPGLGAGLWICRELATRNRGSVELVSDLGVGTRATLSLPMAENGDV